MKSQESEFHQALQCMAGAAAHEEGRPITKLPLAEYSAWFNKASKAWSDQKTWAFRFNPSPEDWDLWRLGWLWAEYGRKPIGPLERLSIRYLPIQITPRIYAVAVIDLEYGTWLVNVDSTDRAWNEREFPSFIESEGVWEEANITEAHAAALFPVEAEQFEWVGRMENHESGHRATSGNAIVSHGTSGLG